MKLSLKDLQYFARGLSRWIESGDLPFTDLLPDKRGNLFMKYLYFSHKADMHDNDFNGLSFHEVMEQLGIEISLTSENILTLYKQFKKTKNGI